MVTFKKIIVLFLGFLLIGAFVAYEAYVIKTIKKDVKVVTVEEQYEKQVTSKHGISTYYCELVTAKDEEGNSYRFVISERGGFEKLPSVGEFTIVEIDANGNVLQEDKIGPIAMVICGIMGLIITIASVVAIVKPSKKIDEIYDSFGK